MDIKFLSEQTGISVRQIRYVLDHELVPNRTWYIDESAVGRARTFDELTGTMIACAVLLLDMGFKRESIPEILTAIDRPMPKGRNSIKFPILARALMGNGNARVQISDERFVRWIIDDEVGEWYESATKTIPNLIPKVIIEIDISQIRDLVMNGPVPVDNLPRTGQN